MVRLSFHQWLQARYGVSLLQNVLNRIQYKLGASHKGLFGDF